MKSFSLRSVRRQEAFKMLFNLFPSIVYQTSGPNVTDLPVEVSAMILRFLDPQSLMNAAKVNKKWMAVCVGDPTLRIKLKTEIKERKKRCIQTLLNPGMWTVVTRQQEAQPYGVNVVKLKFVTAIHHLPTVRYKYIQNKPMESFTLRSVRRQEAVKMLFTKCDRLTSGGILHDFERFLDPQSLMNAAKVNKKWMAVCVGDPTLRIKLKTEIREPKKRCIQTLLNPGMWTVVTRQQEVKSYGVNVVKTIIKRKCEFQPEENFKYLPTKRVKSNNCVVQVKKKQPSQKVLRRLRL